MADSFPGQSRGAYRPPHMRNRDSEDGGRGNDRRDEPRGNGRFDNLDDDRRGGYGDRDRRDGGGRFDDRRDNGRFNDDRRGGWDDRDRRDNGRFNDDRRGGWDDRRGDDRKGGGRGWGDDRRGGGGGKGGGRFNDVQTGPAPKSWAERRDGRGRMPNETEFEVFGELKEKKAGEGGGINFDDYDKIPVEVSGNDVDHIEHITQFRSAGLEPKIVENLVNRCGYERPTPIQKYSFPIAFAKRDMMACAQTGSGKTCAFIVPILNRLMADGPPGASTRLPAPVVLVLAPTRELASQIYDETKKFAFDTGIRAVCVYGGAPMHEQRSDLGRGVDILIATPGRLSDMVERRILSLSLVDRIIFDEADRMLDMGFEPQVRKILEETDIGCNTQSKRQSMMFSATFNKEVQWLARDFLDDYVFVTVGRVGAANELVTQKVMYADDFNKKRYLLKCLDDHFGSGKEGKVLVFTGTKRAADQLERDLYYDRVPVTSIHGDRSQREREDALAAFRSGECSVLVATDVAARGLDISDVTLVIQYELPNQIDDYVHRIGRTGRAGRKGDAIAFVNETVKRPLLKELDEILENANQDRPPWWKELVGSRGGGKGFGGKGAGGGAASRSAMTTDAREGMKARQMTDARGGAKSAGATQGWGGTRVTGGMAKTSDKDDGW